MRRTAVRRDGIPAECGMARTPLSLVPWNDTVTRTVEITPAVVCAAPMKRWTLDLLTEPPRIDADLPWPRPHRPVDPAEAARVRGGAFSVDENEVPRYTVLVWDTAADGANAHLMWAVYNWDGVNLPFPGESINDTAIEFGELFESRFESALPAGEGTPPRVYTILIYAQEHEIVDGARLAHYRAWNDILGYVFGLGLHLVASMALSYNADDSARAGLSDLRAVTEAINKDDASSVKKENDSRDYMHADTDLSAADQSYCRCVAHVSGDDLARALADPQLEARIGVLSDDSKYRPRLGSDRQYNPYAVCHNSVKGVRGNPPCFANFNYEVLPEKELLGLAYTKGLLTAGYIRDIAAWYKSGGRNAFDSGHFLDPAEVATIVQELYDAAQDRTQPRVRK